MPATWLTERRNEHMSDPLEIITIIAASMVKFAISPLVSYGLGYTFLQTLLITSVGGCVGVLVFYRMSAWLIKRARLQRLHNAIATQHGVNSRRRKVFTRTNRFIVRLKRYHGLQGLAALTPILISIPIGTVIAAKYFRHDRRTLPTLLSSVVIWAVVLSSIWTVAK